MFTGGSVGISAQNGFCPLLHKLCHEFADKEVNTPHLKKLDTIAE